MMAAHHLLVALQLPFLLLNRDKLMPVPHVLKSSKSFQEEWRLLEEQKVSSSMLMPMVLEKDVQHSSVHILLAI